LLSHGTGCIHCHCVGISAIIGKIDCSVRITRSKVSQAPGGKGKAVVVEVDGIIRNAFPVNTYCCIAAAELHTAAVSARKGTVDRKLAAVNHKKILVGIKGHGHVAFVLDRT
jgi:hypothetical protein